MLIAIEGIDGSGKHTQAELLKGKIRSLGKSTEVLSFPRYGQTLFAKCIAAYLNGEFGDLTSISPKSAALLYAGDRFESRDAIRQLSASQDVLIFDRYVASNLAHQAARVSNDLREDFISWLAKIEYEVFDLPKPDYTLYLDVPIEIASKLIPLKKPRSYTKETADLHEKDTEYLAQCREVYQILNYTNFDSQWFSVLCTNTSGDLLKPQDIHNTIWDFFQHII